MIFKKFDLQGKGLGFEEEKIQMAGKRHASEEIRDKLARASELAAQGKTQREISKHLGVSIMTYHRWKKMVNSVARPGGAELQPAYANGNESDDVLTQLELENARLRRLVTDMLLEKLKLQEELRARQQVPLERPRKGK